MLTPGFDPAAYNAAAHQLMTARVEVARMALRTSVDPDAVCCPACEQGGHEYAEACGYHRLFKCACACNSNREVKE